MEAHHVLEDEDVVVEGDEAADSDEVGIAQSSATHLLNDYYIQL